MNWHTALLKLVDLRKADPEVVASVKVRLQMFNARRKVWTEKPVDVSETQS